MALRKVRNSTMGKSSGDIRTALENKSERKARLPLYSSVYPYHESQLSLPRVRTFPNIIKDPISTQTEYYKTKNKTTLLRQTMTRPKSSEFSPDKAQMGDNRLLKHTQHVQVREEEAIQKKIDKYHVSKEIEHKKASQETQLVHIEHKSTLEGKVDLKKVADIRRTIRRRYANRNDFRKIFNQWDEKAIGVLSPEDIFKMVNKIGIPINIHEARVLVASANKSNTGALNLNEFMRLIFDQDDKLNVDLTSLAEDPDDNLKIIDMHNLAVNKHTEMLQSQLKTFLKDRFFGLAPQFTRKDKKKTGKVNFEEFVSILNNMDLPYTLNSEKIWKILYNDNAQNAGLYYKDFLKKIEDFVAPEIPIGDKFFDMEESKNDEIEEKYYVEEEKKVLDPLKKMNILNRQKVPVNQLDNFFLRARKIRLFLRDAAESEGKLFGELTERGNNGVISLDQLKDYVVEKLQDRKTLKITKKELEGFLSSYVYNKDGVTPIEEVAKNIYMEDTKASYELHKIKRAVPPIRENIEFKAERGEGVKRILKCIEEKFFDQGSQRANDIFKKFDRDRDGYITLEDLEKALVINQIVHEPEDVDDFMAFLDSEQKGYIQFKDFAEKIRPNILATNKERLQEDPETYAENHQPSLKYLTTQKETLGHFSKVQEELIKDFRPDDKIIKFHASTRYGAKPPHQNTFVHYHMPEESSMKPELITQKKFSPFNVGGEEKTKKIEAEEKKIEILKKGREERTDKIRAIEDNIVMKDQQKMYKIAVSKEDYEMRCKLSSPFNNISIE